MPKKETVELNKQLREYMQVIGKGKNWQITSLNGLVRYIGLPSKKACQEWLDSNYPIA